MNSEFPENDSELSESSQAESPESKVPDTNRPKADEPVPVVKQSRPGRGGFLFSLLAFLLALAAVAGTGWMWWQERAEQGLAEGRIKDEVSRLEGSDRDLASKLSQVRNEVGALSESTVGAELEALQRQIETDRSKMAEVDQALAEQRALARSLQAATDAMQRWKLQTCTWLLSITRCTWGFARKSRPPGVNWLPLKCLITSKLRIAWTRFNNPYLRCPSRGTGRMRRR